MRTVFNRWMARSRFRPLFFAILAAASILVLVAAGMLADGALHPPRLRRASDAAALAQNIGQSAAASVTQVRIAAADGTALHAWWLMPFSSQGRGVMVCHGVADSAFGALGFALMFLQQGYSVLVPESRGHGDSEGYSTYGVRESDDVIRWLQWMKAQGVTSVFGLGESLGGAILLQSLERGANFRALVVESPYSSFEAVAHERVGRIASGPAAYLLVKAALLYVRIRYGVNLQEARPDRAIKSANVPILLIHGSADGETSPDHSRRLANANPQCTTLWLVPGAKHTGAMAANPGEFRRRVLGWFAGR